MNKLLALADRVEKLTGSDREVDAEIFMALGMDKPYAGTVTAINYPVSYRIENGMSAEQAIAAGCPKSLIASHYKAPAYTASLDAAMMLAPEGWGWQLSQTGVAGAWLISDGQQPITVGGITFPGVTAQVRAENTSPALALTCAALRARAHGGGEG